MDTAESAPSAPPFDIQVEGVRQTEVDLAWQPPICTTRNGELTDYEYELRSSLQPHSAINIKNTGGPKTRVTVSGLNPMTPYSVRLRAYTHGGHGPWSESVNFQTRQVEQVGYFKSYLF